MSSDIDQFLFEYIYIYIINDLTEEDFDGQRMARFFALGTRRPWGGVDMFALSARSSIIDHDRS